MIHKILFFLCIFLLFASASNALSSEHYSIDVTLNSGYRLSSESYSMAITGGTGFDSLRKIGSDGDIGGSSAQPLADADKNIIQEEMSTGEYPLADDKLWSLIKKYREQILIYGLLAFVCCGIIVIIYHRINNERRGDSFGIGEKEEQD